MQKTNKLKILYIDDEANNLISFKAGFRFDYDILTAQSAKEAMGVMEQHEDIVAILCDQRMPEKTGVEFFEDIRYKYPKPVRMLITGYTDIEDVVNAINQGHVFRFIRKPWQDADIYSSIGEAEKYYQATSLLVQRNEELQMAYNALDRFAYSVTHDLKGPLISSKALLQVIRNEPDEQARLQMIDMMASAFDKLDTFIDNIFDYYKLRQGELNIEEIDFNKLIEEQSDIHSMTISTRNIRFTHQLNQTMPFYSDGIKLRIIVYNLLANALKYQRADATERNVNLEINVHDGKAVIRVIDNGIGISEEYKDKIFDIFYRATSSEPGSGIGLYNVKDAISKLNGIIEVESQVGSGSTFTVKLDSKAS